MKHYLDCDEEDDAHILNKLKKLMKKLRSANKAGALMMESHLKPIISNATRWNSAHNMVRIYYQIKDVINVQDRNLVPYLLSAAENIELVDVENTLKDMNDITTAMQGADVNLDDARIYLDGAIQLNIMKDQRSRIDDEGKRIITHYGEYDKKYLTSDCTIAASPAFETGIVKILRNQEASLSGAELIAVKCLVRPDNVVNTNDEEDTGNYAWQLQKQAKRARLMESKYICSREGIFYLWSSLQRIAPRDDPLSPGMRTV